MPATVWKGYLSFGLVSFPVRLYSAARPESIHFHMLHKKDGSRIKEVWYCVEEDKPVPRDEIVKGFETSKDQYIEVEEEELDAIAPPTATTMDIQQFVAADEVDPIYFESSYYVAPDEKVSKPYALFQTVLKETGRQAIAKVAMHRREHVVVIRPMEDGLVLHTMYFEDELHRANQQNGSGTKFTGKELELAKTLMEKLTAKFKPKEFEDQYRKNLEHLIDQKKHGKKVTAVAKPRKAPVVDLMEALKKSLASTSSAGGSAKKAAPKALRPARKAS